MKLTLNIIKILINIINTILIILIVLNIFNLILSKIQGNTYITFLDYTYRNITEDNEELGLHTGDFLLIDLNRTPMEEELVLFNHNGTILIGKASEITFDGIIFTTGSEEISSDQSEVIGTVINQIPNLGNIITKLLAPVVLIAAIVILIITSIIQILLRKADKKINPPKPDFNKMTNVNV